MTATESKIRRAIRIYTVAGLFSLAMTGLNCYWAAGSGPVGMVLYALAALLFLVWARNDLAEAWNVRKAWNNPLVRYIYLVQAELGKP